MKKTDTHVRLPRKLLDEIGKEAEKNRRSVNSEIIVRLESTFQGLVPDPAKR